VLVKETALLLLLLIKECYLPVSALQLEKKLLKHFTEVAISNDSVMRGNLYI